MSKYVLLVEGQTDIDFFAALLRKEDMLDKVRISPPKYFGFSKDTVTHFPQVLNILIKQLRTGQIQNLGIVADADYISGGGFHNRWKALTQPLNDNGYHVPDPPIRSYQGTILRHPGGLPPVGLWIMPNHKNNGMLEDFIETIRICTQEQDSLIKYAKDCIIHFQHPKTSMFWDANYLVREQTESKMSLFAQKTVDGRNFGRKFALPSSLSDGNHLFSREEVSSENIPFSVC